MPYLSVRMLEVLDEKLDEGWFNYREFTGKFGGAGEALRALLDLYSQGLLDIRGEEEFLVTDHGRRIVEAWRSAGKPRVEPWLDSRIYSMLYASVKAGGRIPGEWSQLLEERGFASAGELSPSGYIVYESIASSPKRLVVTKAIAAALVSMPEGPAEKSSYASKWLDTLEAMGLIARSVVNSAYLALTGPGRLLRRAMMIVNIDAPYPALVNPGIIEALEAIERGEELPGEKRSILGVIGYVTAAGRLTTAGRLVLTAARLLSKPMATPPTALSRWELLLMRRIREQWRKAETNPELAPTRKLLHEALEKEWGMRHYSIGLALYHLEALGLVEEYFDERMKRQVVRLTRLGEAILDASGGRETSALAVRALVEADSGRSPSEEWIALARSEGILGTGGPTRYGRILARASREAVRNILVTSLEALILKRLPEQRSVPRESIVRSLANQFEESEVRLALDKLESKGLIETRLDGRIEISDVGLLVKYAVLGVPSGVATPVHPHLIRVLEAVKRLGTEDVARLVNETRLDVDTVKTALILARACKYIGRGGTLTGEGEALLEAVRRLREYAELERRALEETGEQA